MFGPVVSIWHVKLQLSHDKPQVSWWRNTICPQSHSVFCIKSLKQSLSNLTLLLLLKHIIMGFQGGGYNLPPLLILVTRCNQIFSKLSNTKNRTQTYKTNVCGFFLIIFSTYFASRLQFPLPSLLLFPPRQQLCFSRYKKKWKWNGVFCRNVAYCYPVQQRVTCALFTFSSRLGFDYHREPQSLTEWLLAVFPLTMPSFLGVWRYTIRIPPSRGPNWSLIDV